jgi:multiple sugar transport system ATP-binding protein
MTALSVSGLTKRFGDITAIDELEFSVEAGEFFVLLGPSANGKTTTLRSIAGIEEIDAGTITFDGEDITHKPVRDRDIAMVFQTFALYPHLTIFENLAYPLREMRMRRTDIKKRVFEVADMLRLRHTLERKPGTASGGEQQRVAIGRALVRHPKLLLLDEPLTNLDAKLRHDTRAELKRLHREFGLTIIYATPDELEALTLGQRIGVLRDGTVVQVGTPDELYERPDDSFVASMVGSPKMNLIPAETRLGAGGATIHLPFGEVKDGPWSRALSTLSPGEKILFGFRPHDVRPSEGAARGPRFPARVHLTEPLGDITVLDMVVNEVPFRMVLPEEQALSFDVGTETEIEIALDSSHVFAAGTGVAIR